MFFLGRNIVFVYGCGEYWTVVIKPENYF